MGLINFHSIKIVYRYKTCLNGIAFILKYSYFCEQHSFPNFTSSLRKSSVTNYLLYITFDYFQKEYWNKTFVITFKINFRML